jgi:hypothetical protein
MKTIFDVNDNEVIEHFRKQNLQKEDYNDVFDAPEFLRNNLTKTTFESVEKSNLESRNFQNDFEDDDFEEEIDRYSIELPFGYHEIELYDSCKGFDENFEKGKSKKYILIEITQDRKFIIGKPEFTLPSPHSKCVIDMDKLEQQNSYLEYIPIDYDTFFGLRFLSYMGYNSDFFLCDERIMFEALLIKFKYFDFKPFYWSKEMMFKEIGIKKDRANKIIEKFINLGIVSKELVKTSIENRPMQITYYNLDAKKIIYLVPKIYKERENFDLKSQLEKYLMPALNRHSAITSKMQ